MSLSGVSESESESSASAQEYFGKDKEKLQNRLHLGSILNKVWIAVGKVRLTRVVGRYLDEKSKREYDGKE